MSTPPPSSDPQPCLRTPPTVCHNLYLCHACQSITISKFNIWAASVPYSCLVCGHIFANCSLGCQMRQIHRTWMCWACETENALGVTPRSREELDRDEGVLMRKCKKCGYLRSGDEVLGWKVAA